MIHIATSHHRDSRFVGVQLRELKRHTPEEHRLYANLYGIDPAEHDGFDVVLGPEENPPGGLSNTAGTTRLGEVMVAEADPDDVIVFMHGDVFPVARWVPAVKELLADAPLAAVQRRENMEPVPHESFCVTTAGYWKEIGGHFAKGPEWESDGRMVTDTAASLWKLLEDRGDSWTPILRSNAVDLHPVWFGIYGDLVYHHGAGFREVISRRDVVDYGRLPVPLRNFAGVRRRIKNTLLSRRVYRRLGDDLDGLLRELRGKA